MELRVSDFSSALPKSETGGKTHTGRRTKLFIPFTFQGFFFFLFFPSPFVEFLRHTAALGSMFEPSLSAPTLDLSVSSWGVGGGIEL